jgi:hypothetical protein
LHELLNVIKAITEEECKTVNALDDEIQRLLRKENPEGYNPNDLRKLKDAALNATKDNFDNAFNALISYLANKNLINPDSYHLAAFKALYQFRNYLERTTHTIYNRGKHFNSQLLAEAFKLYDENYAAFGNKWDSAKNLLCWRKVIGYTQRFLPACYAQAFSKGVYYVVEHGEKLSRSLNFCSGGGSFYPLVSNSDSLLGYDFAGDGRRHGGAMPEPEWASGRIVAVATKLMSSKNVIIAQNYATAPGAAQTDSVCRNVRV